MASAAKISGFDAILEQLPADNWVRPQQDHDDTNRSDYDSIAGAVRVSLAEPVDGYPPLNESVFAGDTVAIVLQNDLPSASDIVQTIIESLLETNIEPADVTVVLSEAMAGQFELQTEDADENSKDPSQPATAHPLDSRFHNVSFIVHDPADENAFAYVAANEDALPMKVNRAIVDADVILPIGFPVPGDNEHLRDCIYPGFANEETQARYAKAEGPLKKRLDEIELANLQLGAFFALQVVTAPAETIGNVYSGTRTVALQLSRDSSALNWSVSSCGSDQLVVASIESRSQDWHDFVEAVFVASEISSSDLPIIIWSDIRKQPTVEIRRACERQFEDGKRSRLSDRMRRLTGILAGRPVFLYSGLSQNVTEELGLGFLSSVDDLNRLVGAYDERVLVRDAHRCHVQPDQADDDYDDYDDYEDIED